MEILAGELVEDSWEGGDRGFPRTGGGVVVGVVEEEDVARLGCVCEVAGDQFGGCSAFPVSPPA